MRPTDRTRALAEERIGRLLWKFSLPAVVGMMAQAGYSFVDAIFVGQAIGHQGVAAVGIAFPFMLVLLAFAMLVGFGANAMISIRLGQRNQAEAERVLGAAALLLLGLSLAVGAFGLWRLDPLLGLFGASPTILPYAHDYLQIIVCGTVFQIVGFGLNAVIRGEGNPRIAMATLLIGVLLNVLLAPLFIFGFGWGMKGAAAATVSAQAVSAAWVLAYFLGGRSLLRLRLRNLRCDGPTAARILAFGSPHFTMQMVAAVMNSLLNNQLRIYGGDLAISIMAIIYRVAMMVAMPIFGINQGAQPIIGFNYGARRFDRVKATLLTAILSATTITMLGFAVAMLLPAQVIRLFDRQDHALAVVGSHAMRISLMMGPLIGFQIISASYFQAIGKPRQAMLLMLSRQVLVLIPAVLLLPRWFGLEGVWYAMPVADFSSSLLTAVFLARELRRLDDRRLAEEGEVAAALAAAEEATLPADGCL